MKRFVTFKLTYSLGDMYVGQIEKLPTTIQTEVEPFCEFKIWQRTFEDAKLPAQICCDVLFSQEVSAKRADFLQELFDGTLPLDENSPQEFPIELGPDLLISNDRKIPDRANIPLRFLPQTLQHLFQEASIQAGDSIKKFIKIIRWMHLSTGRHNPFGHIAFVWTMDNLNWRSGPSNYKLSGETVLPIPIDTESLTSVKRAFEDGLSEPLAHELVREAIELRSANPRSAVLIGMAALETGLKGFIASLIPNSDLLLNEFISPPAAKLMQELIPSILEATGRKSNLLSFDQNELNTVKKWTHIRNKLAHGRNQKIDVSELSKFLQFIRRVLYLLDSALGHEWAKNLGTEVNPEGFWSQS